MNLDTIHKPAVDETNGIHSVPKSKYSPAEEDNKHKMKKLKEAQFAKDPDMFVHIDDIIIAAVNSEKGIGIMMGRCKRAEMELAITRLTYRAYALFNQIDMEAMIKAKQSEIITAPGSGEIIT